MICVVQAIEWIRSQTERYHTFFDFWISNLCIAEGRVIWSNFISNLYRPGSTALNGDRTEKILMSPPILSPPSILPISREEGSEKGVFRVTRHFLIFLLMLSKEIYKQSFGNKIGKLGTKITLL